MAQSLDTMQASPTPSGTLPFDVDPGWSASAPHARWLHNDTLRLLSVLLPPCAPDPAAETGSESPRESDQHSAPAATQTNSRGLPGVTAALTAAISKPARCVARCLDMPDYASHLATPRHARSGAHTCVLALSLPAMLAMRLSIPTLAADFYDPVLLVATSCVAPFAAPLLFGLQVPWLVSATAAAALVLASWGVVMRAVCFTRHLQRLHRARVNDTHGSVASVLFWQ